LYFKGAEAWEKYLQFHGEFSECIVDKENAPGIVHGYTGGHHSNDDTKSCTALVIDSDKNLVASNDIEELLAGFCNLRYFFQWRKGKFHLVFPLAEPMVGLDAAEVRARRLSALWWMQDVLGRELDKTTAVHGALLHPYSKRDPDELIITRANTVDSYFDLNTLLGEIGYHRPRQKTAVQEDDATRRQKIAYGNAVIEALDRAGLLLDKSPGEVAKRATRCPLHPDSTKKDGDSSTVVFPSGWIHCSHDRCMGRSQPEFLRKLDLGDDLAASVRMELDASKVQKVSLDEATRQIRVALMAAKPFENTATVVRVTTGAGKTRAIGEFLNQYSAPTWDEETGDILPGRSALLATPTNALLREVDTRLTVEHRVATGVLAVLNEDGSYACLKHDKALSLQNQGGDVHRLMCAGCEYKEACPARSGARRGDGSLTLTNHALLPSLVREAHKAGRIPLIVWDESPAFVETVRLPHKDLAWMLERFEMEDDPRRAVTLDRLKEVVLFGDQYRVVMRPLIEVLSRTRRGAADLLEAVTEFGATRLCESMLHRGESLLGISGVGDTWDRIRVLARGARRMNQSEQMFDKLSEENQALVLRAEAIHKALAVLLAPTARVEAVAGALMFSCLTPHGELWKEFGGVILDATAPIHDLRALRPDMALIDIAVQDANESDSVRVMCVAPGISRSNFKHYPDRKVQMTDRISRYVGRMCKSLSVRLGRPPRVLLVSYKSYLPELAAALRPEWFSELDTQHFGNTRGYDGWFQRGFDAFFTVGDPYSNLDSESHAYDLLGIESLGISRDDYYEYRARAECAQAHGRARAPQRKKADGVRFNVHIGRRCVLGWDSENTIVDTLK
jgi:hypothetical protein